MRIIRALVADLLRSRTRSSSMAVSEQPLPKLLKAINRSITNQPSTNQHSPSKNSERHNRPTNRCGETWAESQRMPRHHGHIMFLRSRNGQEARVGNPNSPVTRCSVEHCRSCHCVRLGLRLCSLGRIQRCTSYRQMSLSLCLFEKAILIPTLKHFGVAELVPS